MWLQGVTGPVKAWHWASQGKVTSLLTCPPLSPAGKLVMIVTEYMENGSLDTFLRVRSSPGSLLPAHCPGLRDCRRGRFLLLSITATMSPVPEHLALGPHLFSRPGLHPHSSTAKAGTPAWAVCQRHWGGPELSWRDKRGVLGLGQTLSFS